MKIPVSTGPNAIKFLNEKIDLYISIPDLQAACRSVTAHPQFVTAFGSSGRHHGYPGGLAVHTAEVTDYAGHIATHSDRLHDTDLEVVITAAVFHDFMKIREYERAAFGSKIEKTQYRDLVRHVAGSHAEFMKAVDGKDISELTILKIEHAILAHHGRKEWGSPVEPQTAEAFILHTADMMSMQMGPGRHLVKEPIDWGKEVAF